MKHVWQYRVVANEMPEALKKLRLPARLNRNLDHNWQQALLKKSAERRVLVNWDIHSSQEALIAEVKSEEGISVRVTLNGPFEAAKDAEKAQQQLQDTFSKLGNTIYHAEQININSDDSNSDADNSAWFIPGSQLKNLRRDAIEQLTVARIAQY